MSNPNQYFETKIQTAMETGDARLAGEVCDQMRGAGLSYNAQANLVSRLGYDVPDWDVLLFEADNLDERG